jgi:hypothetical protein
MDLAGRRRCETDGDGHGRGVNQGSGYDKAVRPRTRRET